MINRFVLAFLLLFVFCLAEFTFSSPLGECYKEFNTRTEISKCLDLKLKKAKNSLEQKVTEMRKEMEEISIKTNQIYPIRSFNLSQQSYLIFRKTNCNWYFDKSFPASGSSELLKNCLIKMTLDRIIELESSVDSVNISAGKVDDNKKENLDINENNIENKTVENDKEINNTEPIKDDPTNQETREINDNVSEDNYNDSAEYGSDLDDRCYIKPDPGSCEEYIMKYFYFPDGGNCSSFIWSGCEGVVPFETMAECRETCH